MLRINQPLEIQIYLYALGRALKYKVNHNTARVTNTGNH